MVAQTRSASSKNTSSANIGINVNSYVSEKSDKKTMKKTMKKKETMKKKVVNDNVAGASKKETMEKKTKEEVPYVDSDKFVKDCNRFLRFPRSENTVDLAFCIFFEDYMKSKRMEAPVSVEQLTVAQKTFFSLPLQEKRKYVLLYEDIEAKHVEIMKAHCPYYKKPKDRALSLEYIYQYL